MGGSPHGLVRIHMETMSTRKARWVDLHMDLLESTWKPCPPGSFAPQLQMGGSQYGLVRIHIQTMSIWMLGQLRMGGSQYGLVKIHIQTMTTRNQPTATLDSGGGVSILAC